MDLLKVLPIILIVFISGCTTQVSNSTTSQQHEQTSPTEQQTTPVQPAGEGVLQGEVTSQTPQEHTIEITRTGFSPNTLTINLGDKVTFVNKDTAPHWPASAVHPTHCEYKGCGVFDAKKGLSQGESYSIGFDLPGSWKYHDHLNPGLTGVITVQ